MRAYVMLLGTDNENLNQEVREEFLRFGRCLELQFPHEVIQFKSFDCDLKDLTVSQPLTVEMSKRKQRRGS